MTIEIGASSSGRIMVKVRSGSETKTNLEDVLKPFYQRASEAEDRLSGLEAAVASNRDAGSEEHLKTISELQAKLEAANAELASEREKAKKLAVENGKLQYRIIHLVHAIREGDAKSESLKDIATGNYAKSYADVNLEENTEEQSISIENEGEYEETSKEKGTSSSSTQKRQHRKRNRMYEDDGVEKLSKQIGDVAFAIQSLSKNQLDVNALYAEVMKVEGFDEITLGDAFDHLVQNEMLAKAFMVKNANLRKISVQNFVTQHYNRPAC